MNDAELELVIQQPRLPASLASPVPSRGRAVGAWEEHGGISRCSNASVVSIVVAWPPLIRQTARRPRRASPLVPVHQLSALLLQLLALPRSFCYRGTVRRRCGLRARRSTGPLLPLASLRPSRARQPPCPRRRWSQMLSCRRRMPRSHRKTDCEKALSSAWKLPEASGRLWNHPTLGATLKCLTMLVAHPTLEENAGDVAQ